MVTIFALQSGENSLHNGARNGWWFWRNRKEWSGFTLNTCIQQGEHSGRRWRVQADPEGSGDVDFPHASHMEITDSREDFP